MPWKASSPMSERLRFIARVEEGERVSDLAREFGISEKTAYKFIARWKRRKVSEASTTDLVQRSGFPIVHLPKSSSSRWRCDARIRAGADGR